MDQPLSSFLGANAIFFKVKKEFFAFRNKN